LTERTAENRRQCPTRSDGTHTLIAHWITAAVCLERQRQHYHKCPSCQYRGLPASAVLPRAPAPVPVSTPVAVPVRKAKSKRASKV